MNVTSIFSPIIGCPGAFTRVISNQMKGISAKITPYYQLQQDLISLRGKVSHDGAYQLSPNEIDTIRSGLEKGKNLFGGKLLHELVLLPMQIVDQFFEQSLETDKENAIQKYMDCFLDKLDEAQLTEKLGLDTAKVELMINRDSLLKDVALASVLKTKGMAFWKIMSYEVSKFVHHIIETFACLIGFRDIGGARKNQFDAPGYSMYEAKAKFELYVSLFGFPSIVYAAIYPLVGSALLTTIATTVVILSTIVFIPFYMRYLKPCPTSHMGLENVTENVLKRNEMPKHPRMDVLKQILDAFNGGKGVILIGESGVGKTSIIYSLAEQILSKNTGGLLDNAQLFSANGNQIKASAMGIDTLSCTLLAEYFYNHRQNVVFFFDEVDSTFKETAYGDKASKSILTLKDKYPYIIGATTKQEYDDVIAAEVAFNRRFVLIDLKEMEKKEHKIVLYDLLHYKAPELALDNTVIDYIIEKAFACHTNTSVVDAAQTLLQGAISIATSVSFKSLEDKIHKIQIDKGVLEKRFLHDNVELDELESVTAQYKKLKEDLINKEAKLKLKQDALAKLRKIEKCALEIKNLGYELAAHATTFNNSVAKYKWLYNAMKHRILSKAIASQRKKLGLPINLNKAVVDEVLALPNNTNELPGLPPPIEEQT